MLCVHLAQSSWSRGLMFAAAIVCCVPGAVAAGATNLPGFPIHGFMGYTPPTLANLDADPELEIVFSDDQGRIRLFDGNGAEKPGWPVSVWGSPAIQNGSIAVGNLTGLRGGNAIVFGTNDGRVVALHPDGTLFAFPKTVNSGHPAYVSLGNLIGGPGLEVVACSGNQIHVLNSSLAEVAGFPIFMTLAQDIPGPAAIGDIDGDGIREIVAASADDVRWFHNSGLFGAFKDFPGEVVGQPALGDVDGDGTLEIAIGTTSGHVYLMDHNLNVLPGWPFMAIGGVNGPVFGRLESSQQKVSLAFSTRGLGFQNAGVYVLSDNGVLQPGWPVLPAPESLLSGEPVVAELGGSGQSREVSLGTPEDHVHVLTNDGVEVAGFPFGTGEVVHSVAVGRIDGDNNADVVTISYLGLYAIEVDGSAAGPVDGTWPMYGYDPAHSFCYACGGLVVVDAPMESAPKAVRLGAPMPNPAVDQTLVSFDLTAAGNVSLDVFDVCGRRVSTVMHGWLPSGSHHATFRFDDDEGRPLPSGVYVIELAIEGGPRFARRIVRI